MQVEMNEKQMKFANKISALTGVAITPELLDTIACQQEKKIGNTKTKLQQVKERFKRKK